MGILDESFEIKYLKSIYCITAFFSVGYFDTNSIFNTKEIMFSTFAMFVGTVVIIIQ